MVPQAEPSQRCPRRAGCRADSAGTDRAAGGMPGPVAATRASQGGGVRTGRTAALAEGWGQAIQARHPQNPWKDIMFTVKHWGRSSRLFSAAVATALVPPGGGSPVGFPSGGNVRMGGGWSGLWLSTESTASGGTSLRDVRTIIGADVGAAANLTGAGVGVALIDTGVAGVPGLPAAQIVNGPDLSFESQSASLRYLDT